MKPPVTWHLSSDELGREKHFVSRTESGDARYLTEFLPLRALVSKPVFQELKVATMLPVIDSWGAEVNLPGGLAVRFSQKAAAEWIGSVVQALRRPC